MLFARVFGWRMCNNRRSRAEIRRSDETNRIRREGRDRGAKARVGAGPDARGAAHRAVPPTGLLCELSGATIQ
jgi:hypothetical protein